MIYKIERSEAGTITLWEDNEVVAVIPVKWINSFNEDRERTQIIIQCGRNFDNS